MRRNERCNGFRVLVIALGISLATAVTCLGQEVGFLDLTKIVPRTEFRHPAQQADEPGQVRGTSRKERDCSHPASDAPVLHTTLSWLDRSEYQVGDEERFALQIQNVGPEPMSIPFSPHVADLQPADAGQKFKYSTLIVMLWLGGESWTESQSSASEIALYGADDHPDTMLTLQPGEWLQVIGKGKFTLSGTVLPLIRNGDAVSYANGNVSIYGLETQVSATASATIARGTCLQETEGPNIAVKVTTPE